MGSHFGPKEFHPPVFVVFYLKKYSHGFNYFPWHHNSNFLKNIGHDNGNTTNSYKSMKVWLQWWPNIFPTYKKMEDKKTNDNHPVIVLIRWMGNFCCWWHPIINWTGLQMKFWRIDNHLKPDNYPPVNTQAYFMHEVPKVMWDNWTVMQDTSSCRIIYWS